VALNGSRAPVHSVIPVGGLHSLWAVWGFVPPLPHLGEALPVEFVLAAGLVGPQALGPGLPPGRDLGAPGADGGDEPAAAATPPPIAPVDARGSLMAARMPAAAQARSPNQALCTRVA
jgi:hypothetical protein